MIVRGLLITAFLAFTAAAQLAVDLSGIVTSKSGAELKDAIVTLEGRNVSSITNTSGQYSIQALPVTRSLIAPVSSDFTILKSGVMAFTLKDKMPVRIDVYDLKGRLINTVVNKTLPAGSHTAGFSGAGAIGNIYIIKVRMGAQVSLWKYMSIENCIQSISVRSGYAGLSLAKLTAGMDTLRASKAGFKSARIPVASLTGVINITLDSLSKDSTGTNPFDDGSADRLKQYGEAQFFWGTLGTGSEEPLVKITHAVSSDAVDLELVFNPHFLDNTYGAEGHVGWNPKRPHTFRDLHVSDHVEIAVINGDDDTVFHGRLDLLSATTKVSSGYACLGPFGGDGVIYKGDPSMVLSFGSSLDDNWNYYGYQDAVNSPSTDSTYKSNPDFPHYQYYSIYRITFDPRIFGSSGYGEVHMTSVHASPSKDGAGTIEVTEKAPPVAGSPQDPFRFLTPTTTVTPPDTGDTIDIPIDTIPPDTVDTIGVD
ncbi:MAG: carboxypeptidase regulatory-like domain-containing protein [Fibrobacter sp.]|nr:carboxypeptidase regulatory-like domain-containing protein [Fibrobacter sp.]